MQKGKSCARVPAQEGRAIVTDAVERVGFAPAGDAAADPFGVLREARTFLERGAAAVTPAHAAR
jgi:hypothetical protein